MHTGRRIRLYFLRWNPRKNHSDDFLAFLANDLAKAPQSVKPMSPNLAKRIDALVKRVDVSPDESLGEESLL
jgi:hypothetical protein